LGANPRTGAAHAIRGGGAIPGLSGDRSVTAVVAWRRGRHPEPAQARDDSRKASLARANAKNA
jgi:hypothetical protein